MAFIPKTWRDAPDTSTPITAAELNRIEAGIAEARSAAGGDLVADTTPQLGGDLDLNGHTVGDATAADLTKLHDTGTLSGDNTGDQTVPPNRFGDANHRFTGTSLPATWDTGEPLAWAPEPTGYAPEVVDGLMDVGPTGHKAYLEVTKGKPVTRLGAEFELDDRGGTLTTTDGLLAIPTWNDGGVIANGLGRRSRCHLTFGPSQAQYQVRDTVSGAITTLATWVYRTPLALGVRYTAEVFFDGDTAVVILPDGQVRTISDAAIDSDDQFASWEPFYNNTATDIRFRTARIWFDVEESAGGVLAALKRISTPMYLQDPQVNKICDSNGKTWLEVSAASNPVNNLRISNRNTNGRPTIEARGTDANIGVTFQPKGNGPLEVWVTTGQTPTLAAGGADANHTMRVQGKGTGPVSMNRVELDEPVAVADGGTGAETASDARDNLGLGTLATASPTGTPDGTTFLRGDNTWSVPPGGGGGGSGDVVGPAASVDNEVALFSDAGGKTLKRATGSGIPKLTAGVLGTAAAGTDYLAPDGSAAALTSFPTLNQSTTGNAATATQLATPRTIRTNLGSTSTASFDGTANVTPGVTGTLPAANGGTGATTAAAARAALAGFVPIDTTAGTTIAVITDPSVVLYTGTMTHTYRLPTTGVPAGDRRLVINDSTGIVTIQSSGANAVVALPPGTFAWFTARQAAPTTAAHWHFSRPIWTGTAAAYAALGSYDPGVVYVSDGKRVATVTQSATPSINVDTSDVSVISGLAQAITGVTVTGTGKPERQHTIKIKDNGTGRAITWGASFTGTLLATTVANKWHRQLVVWDADVSKWAGMAADTAGY